jgi:hypothetical protein
MGIRLVGDGAAGQDFDAFGRRMTPRAGRSDQIRVFRFGAFLDEIADEAAAAHGEQNGRRFPFDA